MRSVFAFALAGVLAAVAGVAGAAEPLPIRLSFASTFPGSMPLIGAGAKLLADKIARATGGEVALDFNEPGKLVLILANHVGDRAVLAEAIALARDNTLAAAA